MEPARTIGSHRTPPARTVIIIIISFSRESFVYLGQPLASTGYCEQAQRSIALSQSPCQLRGVGRRVRHFRSVRACVGAGPGAPGSARERTPRAANQSTAAPALRCAAAVLPELLSAWLSLGVGRGTVHGVGITCYYHGGHPWLRASPRATMYKTGLRLETYVYTCW